MKLILKGMLFFGVYLATGNIANSQSNSEVPIELDPVIITVDTSTDTTDYSNEYYGNWFWFLDDYSSGSIYELETYYDYNFSTSSTTGLDSSSSNMPPIPVGFDRVFSVPYVNNITIAIPVYKITVSGVSTLVSAPVSLMVTSMPTADLSGLVNLFNVSATTPVNTSTITYWFSNSVNGGTLDPNAREFKTWLEQMIINLIFDESNEFDNVEFDDCDGSCSCDTSACGVTWYLDKDGDGYHAEGSSPRTQLIRPNNDYDWKQGTSLGEDCDDDNKKVHEANKNLSDILVYDSPTKPGENSDGTPARDYTSGKFTVERILDSINTIDGFMDRQISKANFWSAITMPNNTLFTFLENDAILINAYQAYKNPNEASLIENIQSSLRMINRFKLNQSGINEVDNDTKTIMMGDLSYKNYINKTISDIDFEIQSFNNVDDLVNLKINFELPSFKSGANKFNWNSSWSMTLKLKNIKLECDKFTCDIILDVYDHFGLDLDDLFNAPDSKKARSVGGMWCWFILQNVQRSNGEVNFLPFINHVVLEESFSTTIKP